MKRLVPLARLHEKRVPLLRGDLHSLERKVGLEFVSWRGPHQDVCMAATVQHYKGKYLMLVIVEKRGHDENILEMPPVMQGLLMPSFLWVLD